MLRTVNTALLNLKSTHHYAGCSILLNSNDCTSLQQQQSDYSLERVITPPALTNPAFILLCRSFITKIEQNRKEGNGTEQEKKGMEQNRKEGNGTELENRMQQKGIQQSMRKEHKRIQQHKTI